MIRFYKSVTSQTIYVCDGMLAICCSFFGIVNLRNVNWAWYLFTVDSQREPTHLSQSLSYRPTTQATPTIGGDTCMFTKLGLVHFMVLWVFFLLFLSRSVSDDIFQRIESYILQIFTGCPSQHHYKFNVVGAVCQSYECMLIVSLLNVFQAVSRKLFVVEWNGVQCMTRHTYINVSAVYWPFVAAFLVL